MPRFSLEKRGMLCKSRKSLFLLYLSYDSLECFRVVHSEVSQHLTVDFDTSLVQCTHQLRIRHTLETSGSVDTLDPQCTEVALLILTVAVSVGQTLLPSILGNGPNVLTSTEVTSG